MLLKLAVDQGEETKAVTPQNVSFKSVVLLWSEL